MPKGNWISFNQRFELAKWMEQNKETVENSSAASLVTIVKEKLDITINEKSLSRFRKQLGYQALNSTIGQPKKATVDSVRAIHEELRFVAGILCSLMNDYPKVSQGYSENVKNRLREISGRE